MNDNRNRYSLPKLLLFFAWAVLISWLSLMPAPPRIEASILGWDKLQHAAAYAILTLLGFLALAVFRPDPRRRAYFVVLLAVLFGGFMEAAQFLFTTTRTAEAGDLIADTSGALLVYVAVLWRQRMKRR